MKISYIAVAGLVSLALLILVGLIILLPSPEPIAAPETVQNSDLQSSNVQSLSGSSDFQQVSPAPADAGKDMRLSTDANSLLESGDGAMAGEAKEQTLEVITQAMATYSEEGLPVLKPYLSNQDPEIRGAAIEAIKQLAVPAGAEVLRRAAKTAKTTQEQIAMLQAAEFLELPRLPLEELKKLIDKGAVQMPSLQTPPTGTLTPGS